MSILAARSAPEETQVSHDSTPVFFPAGSGDLFGILTRATGSPNGIAVLILSGGGSDPTFGKNQVRRRLALELADRGFDVLRVNYRGVAESGGTLRELDLERPWAEDAIGAVRWLESQGFPRIAIIGQCFGARTALAAAAQVSGLVGLALIAPPVADGSHREAILERPLSWYLKRGAALRSRGHLVSWQSAKRVRTMGTAKLRRIITGSRRSPVPQASPGFLATVRGALDAQIPLLFLYGNEDDFYPDFDRVRSGPMASMLERSGDLVDVRVVDARFGGMHDLPTQEILLASLVSWMDRFVPGKVPQ